MLLQPTPFVLAVIPLCLEVIGRGERSSACFAATQTQAPISCEGNNKLIDISVRAAALGRKNNVLRGAGTKQLQKHAAEMWWRIKSLYILEYGGILLAASFFLY